MTSKGKAVRIQVPRHEMIVQDGERSVYCMACSWYLRGLCGGEQAPGLPNCQPTARYAGGNLDDSGDWADAPIAEDSPAIAGKLNTEKAKDSNDSKERAALGDAVPPPPPSRERVAVGCARSQGHLAPAAAITAPHSGEARGERLEVRR